MKLRSLFPHNQIERVAPAVNSICFMDHLKERMQKPLHGLCLPGDIGVDLYEGCMRAPSKSTGAFAQARHGISSLMVKK